MATEKSTVTTVFGAAVRAMRLERTYSQESFAEHAGIDRSYYGAIERGEVNVSLSTILKIADALDVKGYEILLRAGL